MNETTESNAYDKLTPQRKALVDQVMQNLENGDGLWVQGWKMSGVPESGITGKRYHGVNNFYLTIISMMKGYSDNRWVTHKQMEDKGWEFKKDENGVSLGKGAGAMIEFYELRDKETKKAFDRHVLDGMTKDEQQEYMKENVYPVRKYYRVFNADVIDGIPEKEKTVLDESGKNERAEKILEYWNDNEAKIIYGGNQAFYRPSTDEVHLPPREDFVDMQEFYSTALHEVGHSTGHASRLNRDLSSGFGSDGYAQEELRAEIASMFMEQDLEIDVSEKHIENNSKYIKNWHDIIKENPNALFTAITDADKIAKYVVEKERLAVAQKNTEYFAIVPSENEFGNTVYTVYMASPYGQTRPAIAYNFSSREALMTEFDKFKEAPFWKDKTFEEVSFDELQAKSIERFEAEQQEENDDNKLYFAVIGDEDEDEEPCYKLFTTTESGYIKQIVPDRFYDTEDVQKKITELKSLKAYQGKEFKEVSGRELQEISKAQDARKRYQEKKRAQESSQPQEEYIPPSAIAARAVATAVAVDMAGRGIESLTRMSDRDVVEKAAKIGGDTFKKLYNGGTKEGNSEADEKGLMRRLAMFCNGDEEQLMRVFKSSGQYKEDKPNSLYAKMAKDAIQYITRGKQQHVPITPNSGRKHTGINAKT